jgi:hypothetical protein
MPQQPTTAELEQLRDQLRAEIREARGTLKDLRHEIKTARELIPLLTDELFAAEVKKQVDRLGKVTDEAMRRSVERVTKTFDTLGELLMGEDRTSRRKGKPSIPELLQNPAVIAGARHRMGRADRE